MQKTGMISSLVAVLAVGGLVLAPASANADDKGKKKGHYKAAKNDKTPKRNGRHDNGRRGNDD